MAWVFVRATPAVSEVLAPPPRPLPPLLLLPCLLFWGSACHWLSPYPPERETRPTKDVRDAIADVQPPDVGPPDLRPSDLPPDLPPPDLSADILEVDAAICSATGVDTACDPFEPAGCSVGSCYVIRLRGPACVCPAGSLAAGSACSTTTQCVPGTVCAGDQPPGICRPVCDPASPRCPGKMYIACTPITGLSGYGVCTPSPWP